MQNIGEDYFCFSIPRSVHAEPVLLLAMSGVLNADSGQFKLFVMRQINESDAVPTFTNVQSQRACAKIIDADGNLLRTLQAQGAPSQCYYYFVNVFQRFLQERNDTIYAQPHEQPTIEDLMQNTTKTMIQSVDLQPLQQQVNQWIKSIGVDYFNELTNLSNLIEEVGEVARLMGRTYGQQSFKPNEAPDDIALALGDELSDVLFVLVCLANQMDIDLSKAFARNMAKKTERDKTRHANNPALNQDGEAKQ